MISFRHGRSDRRYLQRSLWPLVAACVGILVAGSIGYIVIERMTGIDTIYVTVITLTTVGFGKVQPLSQTDRIFTTVLIVIGASTLGYTAATLVEYLVSGDLWACRRRAPPRSMRSLHHARTAAAASVDAARAEGTER